MAGINLKFRQIDKILRSNGFERVRFSGDHSIYKRNEKHLSVPCPNCNGLILQRLFKENDIKF